MKLHFKNALNIYTDVSSLVVDIPNSNGIKMNLACAGFLVSFGDQIVFKKHCIIIDDTTSVGEMKAIEMAINWCKYIKNKYGHNTFNIFTDSESSIFSIKYYMTKYIESEKQMEEKNRRKKDKHPGLIRLADYIAYNTLSNDLNVNFIFIPSHARVDINTQSVISKTKKKILTKNDNIESRMPDWKIYSILVGNTAIDIYTREYLLKYKDEIIKEIERNKYKYEFNVKREYPLLWVSGNQIDDIIDDTEKLLNPGDLDNNYF